jgi:hypothetical protein
MLYRGRRERVEARGIKEMEGGRVEGKVGGRAAVPRGGHLPYLGMTSPRASLNLVVGFDFFSF